MITTLRRLWMRRPSSNRGGAPSGLRRGPVPRDPRVDLRRDARAAGRENLPASSATTSTEIETNIVRALERQHRERAEPARVEIQGLAAEFTAIETTLPSERDLVACVVDVAAHVDREVGSVGGLVTLWAERERRLRDLRVFARDHGLARDARYPASRWLHLMIVAVLALLESWANAGFFSEASDFGLIGGFLGACGVALINVVSGFLIGWLVLPWLVYRRRIARMLGLVGLLLAVVFTGAFNFAVASYRDQLVEGVGAASLHDLLHDPFRLSFISAALMATGFLAWAIVVRKGHTFDDAYPFYGTLDHRFREADRAFTEACDLLLTRVVARVQQLPSDLQLVLRRGGATLARLDGIVVEANRSRDAYEMDREDLRARCTAQLKAWREENCFIRTDPPPAYFADYPPFPTLIPEESVRVLAERAARTRAMHEDLGARTQGIVIENEGRVAYALVRVQASVADAIGRAHRGEGPQSDRSGPVGGPAT